MIRVACEPNLLASHPAYLLRPILKLSLSWAEIKIGDFESQRGQIEVRAIRQNDYREVVSGEALDDGVKSDRAAVMPHARVSAIGIKEPAESVGERFLARGF